MDPFQKGSVPTVQHQTRPGRQSELQPAPIDDRTADGQPYKAAGKLKGMTALITGADSGTLSSYACARG
jgi:hypothetical protein